jgi:RNA recognition motif-containing protein
MNIYVGNLDFKIDEPEIIKMFALYGEVTTVKLIRDRETGRSKGFAFIEMPNSTDGQRAIDNLNDSEVMNRRIKVNEAVENQDRPRRPGNNRGGGGGYDRRPYRDAPPRQDGEKRFNRDSNYQSRDRNGNRDGNRDRNNFNRPDRPFRGGGDSFNKKERPPRDNWREFD